MNSKIYVFLSLFLVSVILHVVFAILKKDIIYKISYSLHLPFLGCAEYLYLSNFYPDSEYLSLLFLIFYIFYSIFAVLYSVLSEKLILIPSIFLTCSNLILYLIYKPVYYFYVISKPVLILVTLFILGLIVFILAFSKIKSFRRIFCYIVLNLISLSVVSVTFFNLIYEKNLWCVFAFAGSLFIAAFTIFKTLLNEKRLNFSQKIVNPAIPVAAVLFSLSSAFMYSIF